ncbi:MAG: hypothetical protein ABIO70_29395 [Pseudomonadota bacterium]
MSTLLACLLSAAVSAAEPVAEPAPEPDWFAMDGGERRRAWRHAPVDPCYEPSFSAYTVGRHDWRVGLLSLDFGLLDNLQVGTVPVLDLLGVYNLDAKVTAIQTERIQASFEAQGMFWSGTWGEREQPLSVTAWPMMATVSWRISQKTSLHAAYRWENLDLHGNFDSLDIANAVASMLGLDVGDELSAALDGQGTFYGGGRLTLGQARLAFDWRLNRRDSLIVQVWRYDHLTARIDAGAENADGTSQAGVAAKIQQPIEGAAGMATSLSYQLTWPRFRVRAGIPIGGKATNALLWLPQAFELYWVF